MLNDNALNAMANHLASLGVYLSLHSANPGTTGTNETSAARKSTTWTSAAAGDISITSSQTFTGGAPSGACAYVGIWSALTGGTFYGGFALTGDTSFNSAGEYILDALTINGSAT